MGDLIERLRAFGADPYDFTECPLRADTFIEAADELARLRAEVEKYKVAWTEFSDKTEWVHQTAKPRELGMHRADVLRQRIETAERERDELRRRIAEAERFDAAMLLALGIPVSQDDAFAAFALVRLDAEEGK